MTNFLKGLGRISFARLVLLIIVLLIGFGLSVLTSRNLNKQFQQAWLAQSEETAEHLTSNFTYWLDYVNGPLLTVVNLFTSSGRVSVEEFLNTINYMREERTGMFPASMAFLTKSRDSGSHNELQGWIVAYTTDEDGILRPGSNLSRFGPTKSTIAAALASPNVIVVGPAFERASGNKTSFAASTISNKRQFGIVMSLLDYGIIADEFSTRQVPRGMSFRLETTSAIANTMMPAKFVYGSPGVPNETLHQISTSIDYLNTQLTLHWNIFDEFLDGSGSRIAKFILYGGSVVTILLTLLLAALFALSVRVE